MYQTHANNMRELRIGRQGENAVRKILFDISDWAAELGPGTAELIYQRSGREDPYPVMVGLDGNTIIWTVTERDTEYPYRNGKCELRYYVTGRDGVAKSRMWTTYVEPSIETPAGDPPETEHGWFDQVISAGADAKAFAESAKIDADRAEAAAIRQPYPDAESGTWWIWDAVAGEYVDSGVSLGQELMKQVLDAIGNLDDLKTSDKSSLVAAINEIIRSGVAGGVDPADIAKAVEDYMAAHPIQETDPTVPAWAKQPEKPEYTAAEVHALPDTYTPPVDAALSGSSTNPVQNKVVVAKLSEVESIAKGRATGHVFETETDMRNWIAANASALNLGDNLYIRATDVPDYWWDGTSAQPLETQKVDLTEYAKKSDVPSVDATLTQSGQAADAAVVGQELSSLSGKKVNLPMDENGEIQNGTDGQILQTNGDGTTQWVDKPEGGGGVSGDYIPVPATAEVGQAIVVKAVDENGKPTEWEAVDMASGGEWELLGETTVDIAVDFDPISIANGVVEIDPSSENYSELIDGTNHVVIITRDLKVKNTSKGCVDRQLVAEDYANGIFALKDGDGKTDSGTYDVVNYKIALKAVTSVSMSNIGEYKRYRLKYISPYSCTHGFRSHFSCNIKGLEWGSDKSVQVSGGVLFEAEISPVEDGASYVFVEKRAIYASDYAGNNSSNIESMRVFPASYGKAPTNGVLVFDLLTDVFYKGARFMVWGSNR